jgi:hypothetical protein
MRTASASRTLSPADLDLSSPLPLDLEAALERARTA